MAKPSKNRTATIRLSMEPETKERLNAYAAERHSNVSQIITDWIWSVKLESDGNTTEEEKNDD